MSSRTIKPGDAKHPATQVKAAGRPDPAYAVFAARVTIRGARELTIAEFEKAVSDGLGAVLGDPNIGVTINVDATRTDL
jgi:hypothetical protein